MMFYTVNLTTFTVPLLQQTGITLHWTNLVVLSLPSWENITAQITIDYTNPYLEVISWPKLVAPTGGSASSYGLTIGNYFMSSNLPSLRSLDLSSLQYISNSITLSSSSIYFTATLAVCIRRSDIIQLAHIQYLVIFMLSFVCTSPYNNSFHHSNGVVVIGTLT
jgi:hypothetical protein